MSFLGTLFGQSKPATDTAPKTALDLVTFAAGLVSNTAEVDPTLDKVRGITAQLGPDQEPADADKQILFDVYLQIETYLTTKESIRTFTKDDLRSRLSPELRTQLVQYESNHKGS